MEEEYESERFLMRRFRESDAEDLLEMESDPEVLHFIGTPPLKSVEEVLNAMQHIFDQYRNNGTGRMVIVNKKDGEVMGWTGIKLETEVRDFNYYDLGYRLKRKHWGKGIATETGRASIEYAFVQLSLEKLGAGARIDHLASQHVLTKLGFRNVEQFHFDGDENYFFELRKSEYQAID